MATSTTLIVLLHTVLSQSGIFPMGWEIQIAFPASTCLKSVRKKGHVKVSAEPGNVLVEISLLNTRQSYKYKMCDPVDVYVLQTREANTK